MKETLDSSNTIQDIVVKIIKRMNSERLELAEALKNPQLMTFLVVNNQTGIEEKIKYYDPLYSNNYVRVANANSQIEIHVKVEANEEVSRFERGIIIKKSGYAKIKTKTGAAEWKQCKVKATGRDDSISVKFKSFENSCKNFINSKITSNCLLRILSLMMHRI